MAKRYLLSPQQTQLWLLQKLSHNNPYQGHIISDLRGQLEQPRLLAALQKVQQRNEILRTCFHSQSGMMLPVQLVKDQMPHSFVNLDWSGQTDKQVAEGLKAFLGNEEFNIEEGPVIRARLVRRSEQHHLLAFSLPALCGDSRAYLNMVREIFAVYVGEEPEGAPVNYAAAAEWFNELLNSEESEDGRSYWRGLQVGDGMAMKLSFEMGQVQQPDFNPQLISGHPLSEETVGYIDKIATEKESSPFFFYLACWYAFLWRLTKQTPMVIGVGFDGRSDEDLHEALGLFERFLPIIAQMDDLLNVSKLMDQLRENYEDAYDWQECFTWKDFLHLENDELTPHHIPYGFEYDEQATVIKAGNLNVRVSRWGGISGRFALKLTGMRTDDAMVVELYYDDALFQECDVTNMLDGYYHFLQQVTQNPHVPLSRFEIVSKAEKERILQLVNHGERHSYATEPLVFHAIDRMAARFPDKAALAFEGDQLSFLQLKKHTDLIAASLRARGVASETFVGLHMDRGPEMVTGFLGILKAGGVYMPLDPAYPEDRRHFMLEQTNTALILTTRRLIGTLDRFQGEVLYFDDLQMESDVPVSARSIYGENLAYVIFTSGSTGKPKGVLVTHQALSRHARACIEHYQLCDQDKMLQFSSFNFDASIEQIVPPLMVGATLHMRPDPIWAASEMAERIQDDGLTVVNYPTGYWHTLALEWRDKNFQNHDHLRLVIVGGEAMQAQAVTNWHRTPFREVRLLNAYGPTETTITASVYEVPPNMEGHPDRIPIGITFPNRAVQIVDKFHFPLPRNIPGELWLGGDCLARGYHNSPSLTASHFIPNPFSEEPGSRIYPSGDLACYLDDGNIQFLGREDQQVKIRGFRIELGEVEHALSVHPAINEAVVTARPLRSDAQDLQMVAYLVPMERKLDLDAFKQDLQGLLPGHLVPNQFVILEAIPKLPNGKLDRQALPEPKSAMVSVDPGVHRSTPVEEIMEGIWSDLLGVEKVNPMDNFMDLGGHSLMAMRLVGRLRDVFGVSVPLRAIFNDPTLSSIARYINQAKRDEGHDEPPLQPGKRDGPQPLTYAQQRLWFLDRLQVGSSSYNISVAFRFKGKLNIDALKQAMTEVVKRHHVINARFSTVDDQPVQYITPMEAWDLPELDLRDLPEKNRETRCLKEVEALTAKPFDLTRPPLLHGLLVRLGAKECVLATSMHHIVADGWSIGVLAEEVVTLYRAFSKGEANPLQPLPLQYSDYANWQQSWLKGKMLTQHLAYWEKHLQGGNYILDLPTTHPRPQWITQNGKTLTHFMPSVLVQNLRTLAKQSHCSLYMVLLAAFNLLLSRYSGQEDIVVGTATANRDKKEIEGLIGLFINNLALRTRLDGNPTFGQFLARVRDVALGGFAHQNMPFEQLIQAIDPTRDSSRFPLYQVMIVLQNTPENDFSFDEFSVSPYEFEPGITKLDFTLAMRDDEYLSSSFEYNTDLFSTRFVEDFLEHFEILLTSIVNHANLPIQNLQVLSENEQKRMLCDWNQTESPLPAAIPTHLLQQIVAAMPEGTAIRDRGNHITYGELDRRANRLANWLVAEGVGPDRMVAVLAERSLNAVTAFLGIFKAGGAYVPIDPDFPQERCQFMLEDTKTEIVLVSEKPPGFDFLNDFQVVNLDEIYSNTAELSHEPPALVVDGDNLAYVMYTSGSTGKPKGVAIGLRSIVHLVEDSRDFQVDDSCVMAHCVNTAFDMATPEIWISLLRGWQLAVIPQSSVVSPPSFAQFLNNESVSVMVAPTAIVHFLSLEIPAIFKRLKVLLFAGEAPDPKRMRAILAKGAPQSMISGCGPTEITSYCTRFTIESMSEDAVSVSLGYPTANTKLYIVDDYLNPVPAGAVGDMGVEGFGVARCYYNRPIQTALSFVPNPFSTNPGERLFLTGDMVHHDTTSEGEPMRIDFVARRDHQIKLRGYRIELGEIEAAINGLELVKNCRVLMVEPSPETKALMAYLATHDGLSLNDVSLRISLLKKLPEYMVPSKFFYMENLPLKPTGKVDNDQLKAMRTKNSGSEPGQLHTPTQEIMANIWRKILAVETIGANDNFFTLGGHSLLATQLVSQIQRHFEVSLPLTHIFSAPDLNALSHEVDKLMSADDRVEPPAIVPVPRSDKLPLSFSQQRLWFLDQIQPRTAHFNVSQGLRFEGKLSIEVITKTVETIVARHESLRTKFVVDSGKATQVVEPPFSIDLSVENLTWLAESDQERAIAQNIQREINQRFDLTAGRLWHLHILKLADKVHLSLLTMHHIIADGWSNNLFIKELSSLYKAFSENQVSPLEPLPVGYPDYAHWQRNWLQGDVLEKQLTYWRKALADVPPQTDLPFDRPRPLVPTHRGANHRIHWDKGLAQNLGQLSRDQGTTLFMTLLTAFGTMLNYYSDQETIVVGTDVANRGRAEVKDLIGFFINQVPIPLQFDGEENLISLLQKTKKRALGALQHQDVPFEAIVNAVQPQRTMAHAPLFQNKLFVLHEEEEQVELPHLKITGHPMEITEARVDMTMGLWVTDNGITGLLNFSLDLFDPETTAAMVTTMGALLESMVTEPRQPLSDLFQHMRHREKAARDRVLLERETSKINKFKQGDRNRRRRSVRTAAPVETCLLTASQPLPLLVSARAEGAKLKHWVQHNKRFVTEKLHHHGALLFRGFGMDKLSKFRAFAESVCDEIIEDNTEHQGITDDGKIAIPVEYNADEKLLWHNENSFNQTWPSKIIFGAANPATKGGETTLVDSRLMFDRLPESLKRPFIEKGVLYERNFHEVLGLKWQTVYGSDDPKIVEQRCRERKLSYQWHEDGSLTTRALRPATIPHPVTGDMSWFNQAQHWHFACLSPTVQTELMASFSAENRPRNCFYGDGTKIEASVMQEILALYQELEVCFPWQKGDVLLVDNVLTAHARNSYKGERRLLVAMGDLISFDEMAIQGVN